MAWSPSVGTVEPSDTESIESRESVKSRDTSPFQSPTLEAKPFQNYGSTEVRNIHFYNEGNHDDIYEMSSFENVIL